MKYRNLNTKRNLLRIFLFGAVFAGALSLNACTKSSGGGSETFIPDRWSELPETDYANLPSNQLVVTHFCGPLANGLNGTIDNARNFTMLYDTEFKVAHWVAYPLHGIYDGGSGRTNAWDYDPEVSVSLQMPITGGGYGVSGYDRGHQLPSRDRYRNYTMNEQTFFVTNITPQNSTLNQNEWADLETWIRGKMPSGISTVKDTLYVVTGCYVTSSSASITTGGVTGKIPDAYFKVLALTRSRSQTVPNGTDANTIGFWVENKAPADTYKDWVMPVGEIERKTGFKFFADVDQSRKELSVEQMKLLWGL